MESVVSTPDRVADSFAGWCWPKPLTDSTGTLFKSYALFAASCFTDPICRVREIGWQLQMQPTASKAEWVFLQIQRMICGVAAIPLTPTGMALRYLVSRMQEEPYIHLKGTTPAKTLQGNQVTLYSRNYANIAGGYEITDGGVTPWKYRIDAQIQELKEQNADVLCLSELFDPSASFYMYEELKKLGYTDFYFDPGVKAIAPGAGLFIAAKYAIQNAKFVAFPEATLQDRTKWSCKGFFRFDIASQDKIIARIYSTHLQHSEEPQFPKRNSQITEITQSVVKKALTEDCLDEVVARAAQVYLIVKDMIQDRPASDVAVVWTGDLNMDDAEKEALPWRPLFDQGTLHYGDQTTWGGDKWCVDLVNGTTGTKRVSGPLNLDHTFIVRDSAAELETWLVDPRFDGTKFKPDAISDHRGLKSYITLKA